MKYSEKYGGSVSAPAITGAQVGVSSSLPTFVAYQPSTWPKAPQKIDDEFIGKLRGIFESSMLDEIDNVIRDAQLANGDLQHRGHVVGIALFGALYAISFYGYHGSNKKKQIPNFVKAHFPPQYWPYAKNLLVLYRHAMSHHWNLFGGGLLPGDDPPGTQNAVLYFGLLNFRDALRAATGDFLEKLKSDPNLQTQTLTAYDRLRRSAKG